MANTEGKELVAAAEEAKKSPFDLSLAAIADSNLVEIAEQADKRLAAFEKIWKGSLSRTNANDWVDEGGKPYLQGSGAQKICRWLGVSWQIDPSTEEDLGGGHYLIKYTGKFFFGGGIITETGSRSSKDPFFSKAKGRDLPASEIDKGNVMKAAYTNVLGRGIQSLLGLRNLTWADLDKYAGIKQKDVQRVRFRGGSDQSSDSSHERKTTPAAGDSNGMATEAQVKAIHAILKEQNITDELSKAQKVQEILGLKEAPTSMAKLTKSQASTVIAALQKEAEGGE